MAVRNPKKRQQEEFMVERVSSEDYVYLPLREFPVASPGMCGGRPTIKYHRWEAC
jgi:hypothetical protein